MAEEEEERPLQPHEWLQHDTLGAGAFGTVFLALNCRTGTTMAVKRISERVAESHEGDDGDEPDAPDGGGGVEEMEEDPTPPPGQFELAAKREAADAQVMADATQEQLEQMADDSGGQLEVSNGAAPRSPRHGPSAGLDPVARAAGPRARPTPR